MKNLDATQTVSKTDVADPGDSAHAVRALRLSRRQYCVVPPSDAAPEDLH